MNDFFKDLIHEFNLPLQNPVLIFSVILLVILLSPILLKKLKVPGIIGLIISGVIIGPHGLNILEKTSAVQLFSTIGLLYIMFIAGLELDMNGFKKNRNKSYLFGFLTFIIPITIGFPVCYYLLKYDFNASFLTASMFATHTLVAYPIVSKLGVTKNEAVAISVGGTILTDTAVLIILAVIMGNAEGTLDSAFWIRLGISLIVFSLIMFILIPKITRWFFRKLETEKHAHYIFVLSVVFFAAFLAEVAGVEPIIGAFVAGLVLNPLIPHSSALMNRIEFIGNALFIPFFLFSVGMLVDVRVVFNGPIALIVAGTLSVVALTSKWLAAWFTQMALKYTKNQRQLIFGLSSAHAAATLAVVLVGYKAEILDENILNGTIVLILITCLVASFVAERAAKKIAISDSESPVLLADENQLYNEHILIPISNFESLERLVDFGSLIKDKKSANPLTMLTIVPNDANSEQNVLRYRQSVEKYILHGSGADLQINTIVTIDHNPTFGIVRTAKEIMADIVVMDWSNQTGLIASFFGEKLESSISKIDKNLLICRFTRPFNTQKRLVFICPPFVENESGFYALLGKVIRLAKELSLPIKLFSVTKTKDVINHFFERYKIDLDLEHTEFDDWDDFLILSRSIQSTDLMIVNLSRKGAISHQLVFDRLPEKIERHFAKNNLILMYSNERKSESAVDTYDDFNPEPLAKGIKAIGQLGKELGGLFKGEK